MVLLNKEKAVSISFETALLFIIQKSTLNYLLTVDKTDITNYIGISGKVNP